MLTYIVSAILFLTVFQTSAGRLIKTQHGPGVLRHTSSQNRKRLRLLTIYSDFQVYVVCKFACF